MVLTFVNVPPIEPDPAPVIVVKSLLALVTILGNLLVILAVATTRKLRRHPCNIFICSLAVADMLVGIYVMPLDIFSWLIPMKCEEIQDRPLCERVLLLIRVWLMVSSVWLLGAISYDRYLFVSDSLEYTFWMNKCRITCFLISSWVIPALFVALHVIAVSFFRNFSYEILVVMHILPIIITTMNYVRILILTIRKTRGMSVGVRHSLPLDHHPEIIKRTVKIISLLVSALYLLFLPLDIYGVYVSITNVLDCRWYSALMWLSFVNSTVNPFVYTIFNKDFREAIFRVVLSKSSLEQLRFAAAEPRTEPFYLTPPDIQTPPERTGKFYNFLIGRASDDNDLENHPQSTIVSEKESQSIKFSEKESSIRSTSTVLTISSIV